MNGLSVQKIRYLLITLIFFSCVYICFLPLIVSIDSIEGFLTYKQTLHISNFLFRPEVSTSNVNIDVFRFTGYWSPGQWFYPGALNYLLHLKLGVAAIIVTIACVVTGMIGFYKVFRFFDFTTEICLYSLLLIFSSYTFFYSLIVYQGGETLSFGIFPWFLYFVLSARKPSLRNLLIIASLFFLCFFAKLTLLIYCPIIIAFKIVHPYVNRYFFGVKSLPTKSNGWLYSIPIVILSALIYYMFLVRYPLLHGRFNLSTLDFLTPLASPLTSILSLHQIAGRVTAKVPALSVEMLYVIFLVLFLFFGYMILSHKGIDRTYKFFLMMLYTGICVFFICSYLFNRVDQSPRHFKFLGYVFLPGIITIARGYIKRVTLQAIVLLICLAGVIAFVYLKQDWIKGRFTSENYFYRNYDNKENVDRLDKESYRKLLLIARRAPDSAIFFIQANLDVAMDLPFRCIIPWKNLSQKYFDRGPIIFACLPHDTLMRYPGLLQLKFPDYKSFQLIDRSKTFLYYRCE